MLSSYLPEALLEVSEQSHGSHLGWGKLKRNRARETATRWLHLLAGLEVDFLPPLRIGEIRKRTVSEQDLPFFKLLKLHDLVY